MIDFTAFADELTKLASVSYHARKRLDERYWGDKNKGHAQLRRLDKALSKQDARTLPVNGFVRLSDDSKAITKRTKGGQYVVTTVLSAKMKPRGEEIPGML